MPRPGSWECFAIDRNLLNLFGAGRIPFSASGASALALLVHWGLAFGLPGQPWVPWFLFGGVFGVTLLVTARHRAYSRADPAEVVVDELLGMWLLLLVAGTPEIVPCLVLLALFRVLDLAKPPPFAWIDRRLDGPYAYLVDDLLIGLGLGLGAFVLLG